MKLVQVCAVVDIDQWVRLALIKRAILGMHLVYRAGRWIERFAAAAAAGFEAVELRFPA
jgi:hypothetical protein